MKNKKLLALVAVAVLLVAALLLVILCDGKTPEKGNPQTTETTETPSGSGESTTPQREEQTASTPAGEETRPQSQQEPTTSDTTAPLPEDLPPTVIIEPETDPETGEEVGISFPCQVPGYDLTIEKLAPYEGMFVEDGSNAQVADVAMIMVKNNGQYPVEYMTLQVEYEAQTLEFALSAMPVGATVVVQEKQGKTVPAGNALAATALVVRRAKMEMSEDLVKVTDNGDNTLTVENLTDKTIPTVRVFYKYYMADEDIYVGGIAFTVRFTRLAPHGKRTIQPSHFTSQSSRVVMVLTYDEEV